METDAMFLTRSRNLLARSKADGMYQTFRKAAQAASGIQSIREMPKFLEPASESSLLLLCQKGWREDTSRSWKLLSRTARVAGCMEGKEEMCGEMGLDWLTDTIPQTRCYMWPEKTLSSDLFEPELNRPANICGGPGSHVYQRAK